MLQNILYNSGVNVLLEDTQHGIFSKSTDSQQRRPD
jgi:hypothetical protein